ncbi:hypothetical protein [Spirosoma utsteinense]|uniref:DUF3347 domain-containing protein n=1 Tax=Spirosoma utsteinense TaxID=2585773 RepID=A0ABR6W4Q5_9BACT|nr:hypothetical protein [Spirosoma utsteinense]MBC3785386.1 hypothetical protein [Spirosoma utsteinense]MBC3791586.1 hypothetical protein [Spirosoma utsteinense]
MKPYTLFIPLLALLISACNPERVKYTSELKQEMADKKIKRITNVDLVETVDNFGERITTVIQKELATQLQKTTDPAARTKLCQLQNLPRTKAIADRYGIDIRLLSGTDVSDKSLGAKEREVLDAYLYNAEQKLPQISNIQKINETLYIYNAAVPTDNVICQTCFGGQKTPLAVWRLAFPKREIVRRMKATKKK